MATTKNFGGRAPMRNLRCAFFGMDMAEMCMCNMCMVSHTNFSDVLSAR